jgi:hypothetical protein
MTMARTRVGFFGEPVPRQIQGHVRVAYRCGVPIEPEPLEEPSLTEAQAWHAKRFTDVIVHGDAYSPRPTERMPVMVAVAGTAVRLDVWGRRSLAVRDGRARIGSPEPFTRMSLGWEAAYGGADLRVRPQCRTHAEALELLGDHPGLYPRNPFGRGYLVGDASIEDLQMPNVEDPDDPLSAERLLVRDPAHWWRQPMPAGLSALHPRMFAKLVHFGLDPWFSPPDDVALPEVRCGLLPPSFRQVLPSAPSLAPHPGFFQDAPKGLRFERLDPGAPIRVEGMHPEGKVVRFQIPEPPKVELSLEGRGQHPEPRLSLVRIVPAAEVVELTYTVRTTRMHRIFVPGLHPGIPLEIRA